MRLYIILLITALTVSCADSSGPVGPTGPIGPAGVPGTTPLPPTPPTEVQQVVASYNEYMESLGNDPIAPGLRCALYTVPAMPSIPCLFSADISGCIQLSTTAGYSQVATWAYSGEINQANQAGTSGFNLLPAAFQSYSSNFAVTCSGYFVNTDYNYHEFDVASDDGSVLYINGSQVVQNDGEHAIKDVLGEKYLEQQVYSFALYYFQGPGNVALTVNMDGSLLPAANLYH
jgi:hypothetical protein